MASAMTASGGRGLRFGLFGFPVRIDWSFFVIALLFGLAIPNNTSYIVVWMLVIAASVLVHELGHAIAARGLGAEPSIVIHGLGGWTAYHPPTPPTRMEAVGVALAGPLAGACLGMLVLLGRSIVGEPATDTLPDVAVRMAIWINIGWGLINLAPVLPLDGGHIVEQLLPGGPAHRRRTAAILSVVIGVVAAIVLWNLDIEFGAVLMVMLVASNFSLLRRGSGGVSADVEDAFARLRAGDRQAIETIEKAAREDSDRARRSALATAVVEHHLGGGDIAAADAFSRSVPDAVPTPLLDLIDVYRGDPRGLARLRDDVLTDPDALTVRCVVHAHLAARRPGDLPGLLESAPDEARRLGVLRDAHLRVHHDRSFDAAASIGSLMIAQHPHAEASTWYNVGCSFARAGRPRDAIGYLQGALQRGWRDFDQLDTDPDLQSVRAQPDWATLRAGMGYS